MRRIGAPDARDPATDGPAWLAASLDRELTRLESCVAAWVDEVFVGIYHLTGSGRDWRRWLESPESCASTIRIVISYRTPGSPGYAGVMGADNLRRWLDAADRHGVRFAIDAAAPQRLGVRFWLGASDAVRKPRGTTLRVPFPHRSDFIDPAPELPNVFGEEQDQ